MQTGPAPTPKDLPAFPGTQRTKSKTPVQGGGGAVCPLEGFQGQHLRVRPSAPHGREVHKNGKHLGEYDYRTGKQTKPRDPTREVEK
ncbi:colicin E3/pyocin S6 family cytotoxin [Streptomyces sp. NPDC002122]|uniref:colicin E3/pyocin S6 family cytotoxin n=1 Tax=Streptomyces sp. NPDC002122 TaxID=3154407 RepID=UPI00332ECFD6